VAATALLAGLEALLAATGGGFAERLAAWLLRPSGWSTSAAIAAVGGCAAVPLGLIGLAAAMRLAGRVRPGPVPRWSLAAMRIRWKCAALDAAGRWLSGSLWWPVWLRWAGMRVGPGCEISTIIDVVPEVIRIGPGSFFADGIYLASPTVRRGRIQVAETSLGAGTFLGNHAVVPAGHAYPDELFLGVSTVAPTPPPAAATAWFGQPSMALPRREVTACDRRLTHAPSPIRFVNRLLWETARFALPALPLAMAALWYAAVVGVAAEAPVTAVVLVAPVLGLLGGGVLLAAIVALKWILLGRVRPGQHALWSCWCSRWDFLFVAWGLWGRGLLAGLEGTLLLNAYLRLTGMRIGRRVLLGRGFTQVVDPDMLSFEDDATVACQFQAHTFEDRVLKIDRVAIRRGATAGENAVLLYGADLGEGCDLAPGSVVMKRQRLAPGCRHAGAPVA
jgi:non-ribosomal peptide synthetase-like protein